jgi:hypothetical protein
MKRKMRRRNGKYWTKETSRLAHEAKARKRMASPPPEPEPSMVKWNRFEIVVRDRLTGETGCFELRSLRDAGRRLAAVVRWY